ASLFTGFPLITYVPAPSLVVPPCLPCCLILASVCIKIWLMQTLEYRPYPNNTHTLSGICCLILLALLLAACVDTGSSATTPIDTSTPSNQPVTISAITATGTFREYPLPQSNSG